MKDLDIFINDLKEAGLIDGELFDAKIEKYRKDSPLTKLTLENAFLLINLAEKEMEIDSLAIQQGELLMYLAEKGVL